MQQNRRFTIYTRHAGRHEVAAQTKREALAKVVARLGLTEQQCQMVNTWAISENRKAGAAETGGPDKCAGSGNAKEETVTDATTETEETIRAEYEDRLWAALDYAAALAAIHAPERLARLTQLTEELGEKGWGIRLVSGPTGTNTRGMHFFRAPRDWPNGREKEVR